ncbi:carbon monoxide dehydrogenase subunit G (CoxG) family protein [Streptomyces griseofuscus]|uniref:Carbon monoxide dehydrogenase subunit G (CoxG) family protein n=1 Tax=Streptomyces griseofuscus TaxID=146922 RepID=A0A7H1PSZ7_9ACTN|nr:SRPBCC family protein [Streptomyces griseofuscus]QNT91177.1 carbon monoxide dehydrogenase subunit G (CoxG) family protein [Streptomyces griseofuscus]
MKIDNEFRVDAPLERAWQALTDLEGLAPCMPGAQLTGVDGDVYRGKVKVKVGPVTSQFQGTARLTEQDEAGHSAVISASGKDIRGQGNASATVHARLRPDGTGTVVSVSTDLNISGKLAQFGSGMIKEISEKLFAQFVANVEEQLLHKPEPAEPTEPEASEARAAAPAPSSATTVEQSTAEPTAAESHAPADAPAVRPSAPPRSESAAPRPAARPQPTVRENEPLDLMQYAGKSVYKRLVPVAVGAVVVGVVIYWAVH